MAFFQKTFQAVKVTNANLPRKKRSELNFIKPSFDIINLFFNIAQPIIQMKNRLPVKCPSCEKRLKVDRLSCELCETTVSGNYELPLMSYLNNEEQAFILAFIKNSGSLKEMSSLLNLSYPTVRNMLDDLIERINIIESEMNNIHP